MYVVETQRTRGGSNRLTGGSTRPYRFGEFGSGSIWAEQSSQCHSEPKRSIGEESRRVSIVARDSSAYGLRMTVPGWGAEKSRSTKLHHYREFDLLAVAMYPSTNTWDMFMYTVSDWLLPGQTDPSEMLKFQPVATIPDDDWTDDFYRALEWWRSGVKKKIRGSK